MFGYKSKWGWVEMGGVSLVYFLKGEAKWGSFQQNGDLCKIGMLVGYL